MNAFRIINIKSDFGKISYKVRVRRSDNKAVHCDCQAQTKCKHYERAELTPAFLSARGRFEASGLSRDDFNKKFAATVADFKAKNPKYKHRLAVNHAIKSVIEAAAKLTKTCSKCGGSGHLPQYNHICNGICFPCEGSGKLAITIH